MWLIEQQALEKAGRAARDLGLDPVELFGRRRDWSPAPAPRPAPAIDLTDLLVEVPATRAWAAAEVLP